jgi:hypothetical protein
MQALHSYFVTGWEPAPARPFTRAAASILADEQGAERFCSAAQSPASDGKYRVTICPGLV